MSPAVSITCFFVLKEPGVKGRLFGLKNFPSSFAKFGELTSILTSDFKG